MINSLLFGRFHSFNVKAISTITVLLVAAGCGSSNPPPASSNVPPPRPVAITPAPQPAPAPSAPAANPQLAAAGQSSQSSSAPASQPTAAPQASGPEPTMRLETGLYRCELGQRVTVKRIAPDRSSIVVNWAGKDYTMKSVASPSGALRFEDVKAGLVWLAIVGKSQLLNSKRGQRLANECNL
jgi:membrane-bound inhibitor of C-type lysozyme